MPKTTRHYIAYVEEFHKTFGYCQPSPRSAHLSDFNRNKLRLDLIMEETRELADALANGNEIETLDALCDLQYVLTGAIIALGYSYIFDDAFAQVHKNNMDKFWTESEVDSYSKSDLTFTTVPEMGYIARRDDGKIVKPPHHSKVDLSEFV